MITNTISSILILSQLALSQVGISATFVSEHKQPVLLAKRAISLDQRQVNSSLNQIYKDNILLNMAYMRGVMTKNSALDWEIIRKPFIYEFVLKPGETFAFHDLAKSEYSNVVLTTNSHFGFEEGYKSDGRLYGMGVCHLASVINWAAKDAGLTPMAPTNHDFYPINQVPKEHGVAIYADPRSIVASQNQNLYISNNKTENIIFKFNFDGDELEVIVLQ